MRKMELTTGSLKCLAAVSLLTPGILFSQSQSRVTRADSVAALVAAVEFESAVHHTFPMLYACSSVTPKGDTARLIGLRHSLTAKKLELQSRCIPEVVDDTCTFLAFVGMKALGPGSHPDQQRGTSRDSVVVSIGAYYRLLQHGYMYIDELVTISPYPDAWEVVEWRRIDFDPGDRLGPPPPVQPRDKRKPRVPGCGAYKGAR